MIGTAAPSRTSSGIQARIADAAFIFAIVYLAAAFGVLTRPVGFLAAFWPANALLLGLLVRRPHLASPSGWLAAFAGFVLADLLNFDSLLVTLWLTASNLAGVVVGYVLFRYLAEDDRKLRRPLSVLLLFAVVAATAGAAAIVGGPAATVVFGRDPVTGFAFWFISEFVNYIILLPVCLTMPAWDWKQIGPAVLARVDLRHLLPLGTLLLTILASLLVGGPGAIVFSAPALLWCALTYSLFGTAVLTLLWSAWTMIATSTGILPLPFDPDGLHLMMSLRLGVALLALAPLAVASINNARATLLERLEYTANHDFLTGILSRGAFFTLGEKLLAQMAQNHAPVTVLLLDIDHFKAINDRLGHSGGDRVLTAMSRTISGALREGDLFGRLGGEEFSILLPRIDRYAALGVAERIRKAVEQEASAGAPITISIGVMHVAATPDMTLDGLLTDADRALYVAKNSGRNRVAVNEDAG